MTYHSPCEIQSVEVAASFPACIIMTVVSVISVVVGVMVAVTIAVVV